MKDKLRRFFTRHNGVMTIAVLRAAVYGGVTLLFFGLMSINNWQVIRMNRTSASTALTWIVTMAAMHAVYGGYAVGKKKSKPIIYNMTLAAAGADLVTYFQLQIMNTNVNNNAQLEFFGVDLLWTVLAMLLQAVFIAIMARFGNWVYFKINPPKKCLLILGSYSERAPLQQKIGSYKLQWRVTDVVLWDAPDIRARIAAADIVFVADVPEQMRMTLLKMCYDQHRDVLSKVKLQEIMLSGAQQIVIDDMPFLEMDYHKMTMTQRIVKRAVDIVLPLFALIVFSPLMLLIALAIWLEDRGPVFFRQKRMTMGGHEFSIIKFRTMKVNAGDLPQVSAEEDDPRITRVGRLLRRTRVDELPQLINILRGDMSLVGPRPEMLENVEKYKMALPAFVYREKMKAGLTGYAQIEGRYNTSPEDKLMLDLMYIERFTLWEDVKLLLRTLTVLFKKDSTAGFTRTSEKDETQDGTLQG